MRNTETPRVDPAQVREIIERADNSPDPLIEELRAMVIALLARAEEADRMRGEALTALSVMQSERDEAWRVIDGEERISDGEFIRLLKRVNKEFDARATAAEQERARLAAHVECLLLVIDDHALEPVLSGDALEVIKGARAALSRSGEPHE